MFPKVLLIHANGLRRIIGEYNPEEHEIPALVEFDPSACVAGPKCRSAGLMSVDKKVIKYREIVP